MSLRNVRPVSYTHLDVYKRQALEGRLAGSPGMAKAVDIVKGYFKEWKLIPRGAVSYTHLDVYKRQPANR